MKKSMKRYYMQKYHIMETLAVISTVSGLCILSYPDWPGFIPGFKKIGNDIVWFFSHEVVWRFSLCFVCLILASIFMCKSPSNVPIIQKDED